MRTSENTETVFISILGNENYVGRLNKFIEHSNTDDPNFQRYIDIINEIKPKMEDLAVLEEIILQTRAWENLTKDSIKIIINNNNIYARSSFYRANKVSKEIRAFIGTTDQWKPIVGDITFDALYGNETFINEAYNKLRNTMDKAIQKAVTKLAKSQVKEVN